MRAWWAVAAVAAAVSGESAGTTYYSSATTFTPGLATTTNDIVKMMQHNRLIDEQLKRKSKDAVQHSPSQTGLDSAANPASAPAPTPLSDADLAHAFESLRHADAPMVQTINKVAPANPPPTDNLRSQLFDRLFPDYENPSPPHPAPPPAPTPDAGARKKKTSDVMFQAAYSAPAAVPVPGGDFSKKVTVSDDELAKAFKALEPAAAAVKDKMPHYGDGNTDAGDARRYFKAKRSEIRSRFDDNLLEEERASTPSTHSIPATSTTSSTSTAVDAHHVDFQFASKVAISDKEMLAAFQQTEAEQEQSGGGTRAKLQPRKGSKGAGGTKADVDRLNLSDEELVKDFEAIQKSGQQAGADSLQDAEEAARDEAISLAIMDGKKEGFGKYRDPHSGVWKKRRLWTEPDPNDEFHRAL